MKELEMLKKCATCTETDCEVRTLLEYVRDIGGFDNLLMQMKKDKLPLEIEVILLLMLVQVSL